MWIRRAALLVLAGFILGGAAPARAELGGHSLRLGGYVGAFRFDPGFSVESQRLLGVRFEMGFLGWLGMETELDRMSSIDLPSGDSLEIWTFAIHARPQMTFSPMLQPFALVGVAFMNLDRPDSKDQLSEGLDLGVGLNVGRSRGLSVRAEVLRRGQSLQAPAGSNLVWSTAWRVGVGYGF